MAINHDSPVIKIIETVGVLLIPASLVWGGCSTFFRMNIFECMTFGSGTFLITVCILFKSRIKAWVNPLYPIIIIIGSISGFLYSYESILLKDTGLIIYKHKSADVAPFINDGIKSSVDEIWFYGSNFHISLPANKNVLIQKMNEGVDVYFLAHNPYSDNAKFVANSFNQELDEYRSECESFLHALKAFFKTARQKVNGTGELHFKFYDEIPRMRAYVFDPKDESSTSIFVPYSLADSPTLPGFVFKNTSDGVMRDYFPMIKKLWRETLGTNKFPKANQS